MPVSRRYFIGSLIAAPAIVRYSSLMKLPDLTEEALKQLLICLRNSYIQGVAPEWTLDFNTCVWTKKDEPPIEGPW